VLLAVTPVTADQADDEKAIRAIQSNWDEAWNRNDVKALSSLVAEDVRFVNVAGQVLTGRREFEALQSRTHAMQFKESVRTVIGTDIKFLTPDIAVAHVRWGMRGDKDPVTSTSEFDVAREEVVYELNSETVDTYTAAEVMGNPSERARLARQSSGNSWFLPGAWRHRHVRCDHEDVRPKVGDTIRAKFAHLGSVSVTVVP
jgi:uncharacterized protein (TIGR02246 family)